MPYVLSIDLGTKTSSCAFRTPQDPFPMTLGVLHPVLFKNGENETPTLATWLADGSFCWGDALQERMNQSDSGVSYDNLLNLPKLLFYKQHETDEIVHALEEKLAKLGKSKHDVISGLLKGLWEHSLDQIFDKYPMKNVKRTDLGDHVEVLLSVPQNFNAEQDEHIALAARHAGIQNFKVISESVCAASYHLQWVKQQYRSGHRPLYRKGDRIAMADLGGGTNDFGIYSCVEAINKGGPDTVLSPIQQTLDSRLSGSEFVNERFRRFVKLEWSGVVTINQGDRYRSEKANFEEACRMVQISPEKALMDLSDQFEYQKRQWDGQRLDWQVSLVAGQKQNFHVQLKNDHMENFFEPSIKSVISWLKEYRSYDYKLILLTGGLSRSGHLRRLIEAESQVPSSLIIPRDVTYVLPEADKQRNSPPVACGAVLRYQNIKLDQRDLHPISYGVVNDSELFDALHHPDGLVEDESVADVRKRKRWDDMVVKTDPHTGEDVVEDRIASWMTRKGESVDAQKIFWQVFLVRNSERTMSARICWTTKSDIVDHEPIYVKKTDPNEKSQLRQGYNLLSEILTKVEPEKYGYTLKRFPQSADLGFEVNAAIALRNVNGRLQFNWRIAKAGEEPLASKSKSQNNRLSSEAFEKAEELFRDDEPMHDLRWYTAGKLKLKAKELQEI